MTTILKLGGSVITDKTTRETIDDSALVRASDAIAAVDVNELVLVHGGGSFGHPNAAERNVSSNSGTNEAADVRAIHRVMGQLLRRVTDDLGDVGVPAVPVRPFSAGYRTETGAIRLSTDPIRRMVDEGFVPVLHGDVFVSEKRGATIVSGDELVVSLAETLDANRVGLCSTVPGVLDENGDLVRRIERYEDVETVLGGSESTDVTGGMAGKVNALLELETAAQIFDLNGLTEFLDGGTPGTRIAGQGE